jgi:HKD family nuclease
MERVNDSYLWLNREQARQEGYPVQAELFLQSPKTSSAAFMALSRLVSNATYTRMRTAIAFASRDGVSLLAKAIGTRTEPLSIKMVVGLDGHITEPKAIEQLSNLFPNEVRCFESLEADTMFHAKTFCFDDEQDKGHFALLIGSSNLSVAGLLKNREGGLLLKLDAGEAHVSRRNWETWWQQVWNTAQPVTPNLIAQYTTRYRHSRRMPSPDRISGHRREHATVSIRNANELWLEVGAITGGSANQLEIPREIVTFFRVDPNRFQVRRLLVFTRDGHRWGSNLMAYYMRNGMWRINLNTSIPEVSGKKLRGLFVRFKRTKVLDNYEFSVLKATEVRPLQIASGALGNSRTTLSRAYGWL